MATIHAMSMERQVCAKYHNLVMFTCSTDVTIKGDGEYSYTVGLSQLGRLILEVPNTDWPIHELQPRWTGGPTLEAYTKWARNACCGGDLTCSSGAAAVVIVVLLCLISSPVLSMGLTSDPMSSLAERSSCLSEQQLHLSYAPVNDHPGQSREVEAHLRLVHSN